ncbi:glycosyltransferase, partial [Bacillus cereus]|uniref:glycosyltransferase n=1 Tax=Bacillus cereus TaxID=1396 RepID=UPI003602A4C5
VNMSSVTTTVSVALCTWQGERYIAAQLRTVGAQTVLPTQVVIVDDASTDGTWGVLEQEVATLHARGIEVVLRRQQQNVGYVRNFESALLQCSGDIVFLCDQDDLWREDKIETFLRIFDARPGLRLLHSNAQLV